MSQKSPTELVLAESVAEIGQKGQMALLRGLLPKLMETFSPDSELLSKPVTDWKSGSSMANLFAKFSGIGQSTQAVQVNLFQDDIRPE